MLQNPHRSQPEVHHAASKTGAVPVGAKKLAQHSPSSHVSAKNSPGKRKDAHFGVF